MKMRTMNVRPLTTKFRATGAAFTMTLLMACTGAAQAAEYTMYRDANCGCCKEWAMHAETGLHSEMAVVDSPDMNKVKAEHGVPANLQSCHTAIIEGYVIEGHVPAADIERLLATKPDGVTGLAVAGMPMGSPGMEHGDHKQAFQVIAFGSSGQSVFSAYPAS